GPGPADRLRDRRGRNPRDAGRVGDDHHPAARRLTALHRAGLRDRLLVRAQRGTGGREPDLPAAVLRLRALRPAQPAPGFRPEARALPAELQLRAARLERARRRTRVARRELAVARGLLGALPRARREILSSRGAREVRVARRAPPLIRAPASPAQRIAAMSARCDRWGVSGVAAPLPPDVQLMLVDLALAPGPVGLAELELLELAGGRAGERVAQLDRRRALVVRHARATERDQVRRARLGARAEHDQRLDGLAPLLVGDADHGGLGDGGVLVEAVLDLDRRDVLAAGDDHVLLPVGDHHVGVLG